MSGEIPNRNNEQHSDAEERELTAAAIGGELDTLFDRHADFSTQDEDGTKRVTLRVQFSTSTAPAHVESRTDENGERTAWMWIQPGKALGSEMFKYTDGPDGAPTLEPYTFDADGQRVPRSPIEQYSYDPNNDHEVAYWGDVWVRNLRELPAIDPNSREAEGKKNRSGLLRFLGKFASR